MPDDPILSAATPATPPSTNGTQATPPAAQTPPATPPSSPGAAIAGNIQALTGGAAPSVPAAPSPGTQAAFAVRDYLRQRGVDPSQFQSDQEATDHLLGTYQQARQLNGLAQYGQRYLQHAPQFETWLKEQAAAQQKAEQPKQWWAPPEWQDAWLNQVETDANGEIRAKNGYPMDLPLKIQQFRQHQQNFLHKFTQDPIGAIKQGIMEVVQPLIEGHFQKNLSNYQDRSFASNWEAQNSSWLYTRDAENNILHDVNGARSLSPAGQRFVQLVKHAEEMGVTDVRHQEAMARQMLRGELAEQALRAQTVQAGTPPPAPIPPGAMHTPSHGASLAPPSNPVNGGPPQNGNLSLRDTLMRAIKGANITDADFASV